MKQVIKIIAPFIFLYLGVLNSAVHGQDSPDAGKTPIDSIKSQPSFSIYGDNYLITGTEIGETPTKTNSDAKFQIGFKQRLARFDNFFDTYLFLTYRQLSFWGIYQNSLPFRETNYNPSILFGKILIKDNKVNGGIWMEMQHESNGLDGEDSRSWNFISLKYATTLTKAWYGSIEGWLPLAVAEENSDILNYRSNFELGLTYYPTHKWIFQGDFRRSFTSELLGRVMLTANYRLVKNRNQFIYLQYYNGNAESLIDYQQHVHMIRIGIAFKDLNFLYFN